uniref:Transposase Tnp1/En/Spm-like domain-containing protein n=1 Tax=Nelumbo nucifera TaxID=4432 RepID=A0A822ZCA8_NELNU|nr:TPA_asm: hypothetical protein HUJ06_001002 [Nelumbo nucifera]
MKEQIASMREQKDAMEAQLLNRQENTECNLLIFMQGGIVSVTKATITSLDSQKIVGGVPLGYGWTGVVINVPIISDAPLVRPYGHYRTVGTNVGVPIAWSSIHV